MHYTPENKSLRKIYINNIQIGNITKIFLLHFNLIFHVSKSIYYDCTHCTHRPLTAYFDITIINLIQ